MLAVVLVFLRTILVRSCLLSLCGGALRTKSRFCYLLTAILVRSCDWTNHLAGLNEREVIGYSSFLFPFEVCSSEAVTLVSFW